MTLGKLTSHKDLSHFTIIKVLKKFSLKELNEFEKLLSSPFFNNHSTVTKLFGELKNFYPQFSNKMLTKEYLFEIINPGEKYDDIRFQKYMSRMNKLAEEYFSIIELHKDNNDKELKVLLQLSKRDLKEVYSRKLKEFEINFDKNNKIDENYYLLKHKLSDLKYFHRARGNIQFKDNSELFDSYNYLINYFLVISGSTIGQLSHDEHSYKYSKLEITPGIFYERAAIEKNIAEIIKSTSSNDKKRLLFLALIQNDLKMNSEKYGLKAYKDLRKIVFENSEALGNSFLMHYLKRLNMYCMTEIGNGKYDFNKDLLKNFRLMLEKKLFFLDEIPNLPLVDYRVILFAALRNNEIEWAEKFISESVGLIKEESRENIINFGYAVLLFFQKNYSGSLDYISMIRYELLPITIDIYVLRSKIFYELGFFDTALSVADSLRHFIKNNNVMADVLKNSLRNFCKFFTTLMRLNKNYNKVKHTKLLSELVSSSGTWNKIWLIEKTNEIINK